MQRVCNVRRHSCSCYSCGLASIMFCKFRLARLTSVDFWLLLFCYDSGWPFFSRSWLKFQTLPIVILFGFFMLNICCNLALVCWGMFVATMVFESLNIDISLLSFLVCYVLAEKALVLGLYLLMASVHCHVKLGHFCFFLLVYYLVCGIVNGD